MREKGPKRRRPFGLTFVESASPALLAATILFLYSFGLYISHPLDHLRGTEIRVHVHRVVDGDTFVGVVQPLGVLAKFRLKRIDAPELDQPGGDEARVELAKLLLKDDSEVVALVDGQDEWGRYVVDVVVRDALSTHRDYVQQLLASNGWAWVVGSFARSGPLKTAMDVAQAEKRGLWGLTSSPVEPWKHRWTLRDAQRPNSKPKEANPKASRKDAKGSHSRKR